KKGTTNLDSPRKARICGAANFNDAPGIKYSKTDLFKFNGVCRSCGYEILGLDNLAADRTLNNSIYQETCGWPHVISQKKLHEIERFLQDEGWDARVKTWDELVEEFDLDCAGETLCAHTGSLDYHKCIACCKGWVSQRCVRQRVKHSETMLALKPDKEDWRDVRFSDKAHWSVGPEGKMKIIRKPGERYCSDCIQE
ncbi:hypothetical protein BU25DRAFT_316607, partial [Macroventuria anomochaeta]